MFAIVVDLDTTRYYCRFGCYSVIVDLGIMYRNLIFIVVVQPQIQEHTAEDDDENHSLCNSSITTVRTPVAAVEGDPFSPSNSVSGNSGRSEHAQRSLGSLDLNLSPIATPHHSTMASSTKSKRVDLLSATQQEEDDDQVEIIRDHKKLRESHSAAKRHVEGCCMAREGKYKQIKVRAEVAEDLVTEKRLYIHYVYAELILKIAGMLNQGDDAYNHIAVIEALSDDPVLEEIRFYAYKATTLADLEKFYEYTKGDGYCQPRATHQNQLRYENPSMSMADLRAADRQMTREQLAQYIESYLKCVICSDKDEQFLVDLSLKTMAWNARTLTHQDNRRDNWGQGHVIRFLPGQQMLFRYDDISSQTDCTIDGEEARFGQLARVNYKMTHRYIGRHHAPTLSHQELKSIFENSNNIAFESMHYFILENKPTEDANAVDSAVDDWLLEFIGKVSALDDVAVGLVRVFVEEARACKVQRNEQLLLIQRDTDTRKFVTPTVDSRGAPLCLDYFFDNSAPSEVKTDLMNVVSYKSLLSLLLPCDVDVPPG